MRYLFSHWDLIEKLIKEKRHVLLLTDYDGTLTPIVSKPEKAVLDKRQRKALAALSGNKRYRVGVISGRSLADVKALVRIKGIYYAGNHGLEIKGPGISFTHRACAGFISDLKRLSVELASSVKSIKGAVVENKGASVSLHYRAVNPKNVKQLKAVFNAVCVPYIKKGRAKVSSGKKILEIKMPINWHKGDAVGRIWNTLKKRLGGILPIYLGDDVTDEDAFLFLRKRKALTVFVGRPARSAAEYYLRSPLEVRRLLIRLCRI